MSARNKRAGKQREAQWAERLYEQGWEVGKPPRINGEAPYDWLAARNGAVHCWEVKSTKAGPFSDFGPAKRQRAREAASRAGASLFLCHWPFNRKPPRVIPESEWPE